MAVLLTSLWLLAAWDLGVFSSENNLSGIEYRRCVASGREKGSNKVNRNYPRLVLLLIVFVYLCCPRSVFATLSECSGHGVVFDSNSSGTFGIYSTCVDGGAVRVVVDTAEFHELFPDPSPDGRQLIYTRSKDSGRDASGEIWLRDLATGKERMLSSSGAFATFSADGRKVFFEREKKAFFEFDLERNSEQKIFPWGKSRFDGKIISQPRISSDGTWLYFTSEVPNRWNAWRANLQERRVEQIGHGCQPSPYGEGADGVWIKRRSTDDGSDVQRYRSDTRRSEKLHDAELLTFAYYPQISAGAEYLLYSGCRCSKDQNSHETGNYEVLAVNLKHGGKKLLTNNGATNRWPKLLKKR